MTPEVVFYLPFLTNVMNDYVPTLPIAYVVHSSFTLLSLWLLFNCKKLL